MKPAPPSFTLRQLSYLVAAADAGTITGAAELVHVSPSAMSGAITDWSGRWGRGCACVARRRA